MLRVLHVPFTFAPDPIGGTEIYVGSLAERLRDCDIESVIAAPSTNGMDELYDFNNVRVHRYCYAPDSPHFLRELYGDGDPTAALAFGRILDAERPDVVHLHAFTRAVSVLSVRAAKQRGIPVFFTYHTPTVSCHRGTLMLYGENICDGFLNARRCTECSLANGGVPRWASMPLSYVPSMLARALERADLSGGVWTALRMADLIRTSHQSFRTLISEVDGIVALREWVRALLIGNGVPASKIVMSPHGLPDVGNISGVRIDVEAVPLRVAFLGRADKVKGIDTLISALKMAPNLRVEIHLYGITQSSGDQAYKKKLDAIAAQDARIKFLPPIPHEQVVSLLASYHLLAVPSRWMETGPLVILEAFAAGTPVLGSNLGGIAEWVRDGENGLLVDFDDVSGWADALGRCASDRRLLTSLRQGVQPPRSMAAVAQEMARMYQGHLASHVRSSPSLSVI